MPVMLQGEESETRAINNQNVGNNFFKFGEKY